VLVHGEVRVRVHTREEATRQLEALLDRDAALDELDALGGQRADAAAAVELFDPLREQRLLASDLREVGRDSGDPDAATVQSDRKDHLLKDAGLTP
jgi:hypothetical protein